MDFADRNSPSTQPALSSVHESSNGGWGLRTTDLRMSLQLYVAHTGERYDVDPVSFSSLDALRNWLSKTTSIRSQDQILLTTRGKHVKLQALLTEKELFLYDRNSFTLSKSSNAVPESPLPKKYLPEKAPDTLTDQNDLKAWQSLFKSRRDWSVNILERCRLMAQEAQKIFQEQSIIERGPRVASGNHESHVRSLEQKHAENSKWYSDLTQEQEANLVRWEQDLERLKSIPAKPSFLPLISTSRSLARKESKRRSTDNALLYDFVDIDAVRHAADGSKSATDAIGKRLSDFGNVINKIVSEYHDLSSTMGQSQSRSLGEDGDEPFRLYEEIEIVVKKVASDYDHVLSLTAASKPIASVSKMALLHTRNYLPTIAELSVEMSDLLRRLVEQKNSAARISLQHMQAIAAIESKLSSANNEVSSFDIPPNELENFEIVASVSRLPFTYGSLLIEAFRRREWVDKIKKDSAALAEEIATYREEEEQRRKKWLKSMSDLIDIDSLQGPIIGVEINLKGDDDNLPAVTRTELEDFLRVLREVGGFQEELEVLIQTVKTLNKPTKQQVKRAKTFKMGSVHEAAFGKGSLMLRGEDEAQVLKDANAKLQEELRGQKSRVRKLEDLLHRQTQLGRLPGNSGFQSQMSQPGEPSTPPQHMNFSPRLHDELSRRSSVSSRRFSLNQNGDEKAITRRIMKLEADLGVEREQRESLEEQIRLRINERDEMQQQVEEANFTKRDLMANLESLQQEFTEERKILEDELSKLKFKFEETEDELDRVLASRDSERTSTDARIEGLIAELANLKTSAADEVQTANDRVAQMEEELEARSRSLAEDQEPLISAYSQLAPEHSPPSSLAELANDLERLVQQSVDHAQELSQAINMAKSENEALRTSSEKYEAETKSLYTQLHRKSSECIELRDRLASEAARVNAITSELEEERGHLLSLRTKFAEGETGSEALRQRITDEEKRVGDLSSELAAVRSHADSLNAELLSLQAEHHKLEITIESHESRLGQRATHAKDITQRLFAQRERLYRLLESLGFAVTYSDEAMLIQRASKSGASTVLMDANASSVRVRVENYSSSTRKAPGLNSDINALLWMEKDSSKEEAEKFEDYIKYIDSFDLETFCDAISKRMRDIEHTARKWQKEARAYREKSHRSQSEAHDKIAFRSFKEGDLALFLPTRNQATRPWAAFNVGAPHYFLREQDTHKLHNKEWLVARISKIEERVVNLSKAMENAHGDNQSLADTSDGGISYEDDNPFELSDGLRWYLIDAAEEKSGAPSTPGMGKSTVASAHVDARGSIRINRTSGAQDASKTLNKSLDSRRSSSTSKKSAPTSLLNQPRGSSEALRPPSADAQKLPPTQLRTESQPSQAPSQTPQIPQTPQASQPAQDSQPAQPAQPAQPTTSTPTTSNQTQGSKAGRTAKEERGQIDASLERASGSPSKQVSESANVSPTKRPSRPRSPWESLWRLDINLEGGKSKK